MIESCTDSITSCENSRRPEEIPPGSPHLCLECPYCGGMLSMHDYVYHVIACRALYNPLGTRDAEPLERAA